MKIKDLLEKGMIKKDDPDISKSKQSMKVAYEKLDEAIKSLEAKLFDPAIVFAYMGMFHAARSLLFKEGYKEKSHFAIVVFLEEKYSDTLGVEKINLFNTMRMQRHEGLYGLESEFLESDAKIAIDDARGFIEAVKNMSK